MAGIHTYGTYIDRSGKKDKHVSLDKLTLEQLDAIVKKSSRSNQERMDEAITKADGQAWLEANPWFKRTDANLKIVNKWLAAKGINYPTFPHFTEAAEGLANSGLIDVDEAAYAQHLDGNGPKKFKGTLTGRTFDSLDALISQERHEALHTVEQPTDLERAFEALPIEQQQRMLLDAMNRHQSNADRKITEANADSWLTLHPEFRDDNINGKLMLTQLRMNGVVNRPASVEDYEIAERQLAAEGMIRQNPAQVRKQQAQEVLDRAERAVNTPGSVFDKTSEQEMYNLPMDELRRRANGNYSGR